MKIDLHCHSKYSKRPVLWLMQKIGCPESFTEPVELYHLMRNKGMNAVTITDHNTIDGALEIAGLPDAFVSCEYTTYFPDDNCKVHVVAHDITEAQHRDMSQARRSVYELTDYLRVNQIRHVLAHPLFSPNDRLTADHVEKLILLFKNWEWNGDIAPEMNMAMRQIVEQLTPRDIERLANKHKIVPRFPEPWRKNLTAGSDDHSSLNLAGAHTEAIDARNFDEFWMAVEEGQAKIRSMDAKPETLARSVYGIAYQFYKGKLGLERHVRKDLFLCFLEKALRTRPEGSEPKLAWYHNLLSLGRRNMDAKSQARESILNLARSEAEKMIRDDPQLMAILKSGAGQGASMDQKWFEFVNQLSNKLLIHFGKRITDRVAGGQWFDLFASIGSAGVLYALLAPYFVAFSLHTRQRKASEGLLESFSRVQSTGETSAALPCRVAIFSDTFHEDNSVARHLRKELGAAMRLGIDYSVVTCRSGEHAVQRGVHAFQPVGKIDLPDYSELPLLCPPFLQILQHCCEEQFTHIHAATPGPMGLAALGVARILKLPVSGTFHASIPRHAHIHTEDGFISDVLWRYLVWFYEQMDRVYTSSQTAAEALVARGVHADKIHRHARGADIRFHHPRGDRDALRQRFGLAEGKTVFLYAGKLRRDRNLELLAEAFAGLSRKEPSALLVMAGDGPVRAKLEKALKGQPAIFTGHLDDESMAELYAACDVFVYPGDTDTFGDSVFEAQASGLPVIAPDSGAAMECVIPGETALVVKSNHRGALQEAMETLLRDPARRAAMGRAAHRHMEERDFDQAFEAMWRSPGGEARHEDEDRVLSIERLAGAALQEAMM